MRFAAFCLLKQLSYRPARAKPWIVRVRQRYVGSFSTEQEACCAAEAASLQTPGRPQLRKEPKTYPGNVTFRPERSKPYQAYLKHAYVGSFSTKDEAKQALEKVAQKASNPKKPKAPEHARRHRHVFWHKSSRRWVAQTTSGGVNSHKGTLSTYTEAVHCVSEFVGPNSSELSIVKHFQGQHHVKDKHVQLFSLMWKTCKGDMGSLPALPGYVEHSHRSAGSLA